MSARRAILLAARSLLEEVGFGGVTVEGIAARAGVGKPTIYRNWPNAQAVVMAALIETVDPSQEAVADTVERDRKRQGARRTGEPRPGSALEALRRQLRHIAEVFATRTGRSVTRVLAAAETDTELWKAFRHHFILARREEACALLCAAVEAGELRSDIDLEVVLDLIHAPIFHRLLVGHAPLDGQFTDAVLRHVLEGLAAPRASRAKGRR